VDLTEDLEREVEERIAMVENILKRYIFLGVGNLKGKIIPYGLFRMMEISKYP
jgi:hypothetical protein